MIRRTPISTQWRSSAASDVYKRQPIAVQLKEAAKITTGSAEPNRNKVASVTWDQVRAIAENKMEDMNAFSLNAAMSMVAGTARSMGITVTGTAPEGVIKTSMLK